MWLKLNLNGLKFDLKIDEYSPNQMLEGKWANISFSFEFQNIIHYSQNQSESLLCYEIDNLVFCIEKLLNNKIAKRTKLEGIEPDFTFIFNPKNHDKQIDINMEMKVALWNEGFSANSIITTFDRDNIEKLYLYLSLVTNKVDSNDLRIRKLIEKGIIYTKI